jgi:flagellar basal body-associated protein FliL
MRSTAFFASLMLAALAAQPACADGSMPEHKITQSESYIMLEPMYATIIDSNRPSGMLMVAIGLDIPDAKLRAQVERAMPLLRDDYVRSLMSYAWSYIRPWQQPDVADIADRLQRVTDRALHRPGARVLLAEVGTRITR